jgi:hypothetical protein
MIRSAGDAARGLRGSHDQGGDDLLHARRVPETGVVMKEGGRGLRHARAPPWTSPRMSRGGVKELERTAALEG